MKYPLEKFREKFSEIQLFKKIKNFARQAGMNVVYAALLLYYAYRRAETPQWARNIVLGALGYFISPIDFIPDMTPFLGYTDDLGALGVALSMIGFFVNDEVKENARDQLKDWFGEYDVKELTEVEKRIE